MISLTHAAIWELLREKIDHPIARRSCDNPPNGFPSWKAVIGAQLVPMFNCAQIREEAERPRSDSRLQATTESVTNI